MYNQGTIPSRTVQVRILKKYGKAHSPALSIGYARKSAVQVPPEHVGYSFNWTCPAPGALRPKLIPAPTGHACFLFRGKQAHDVESGIDIHDISSHTSA